MEINILLPFLITFAAGLVLYLFPNKVKFIIKIITGLTLTYFLVHSISFFFNKPSLYKFFIPGVEEGITFSVYSKLSLIFILFTGVTSLLIYFYTLKSTRDLKYIKEFYIYYLWSVSFSYLVLISNNILVVLFAWGFLGFTLYKLVNIDREKGAAEAKKVFLLIGATDAIFIFGIGAIFVLTKKFNMSAMSLSLSNPLSIGAFVCLIIAAFAKAGVFPLHTWITDTSLVSRPSVMAFLPASLDKIIGLFFFIRILHLFKVKPGSAASIVLASIGAATIIIALMMNFPQKNLLKILSYHLISQVGYMVVGISLGTPLALLGGIFHIFNHIIYKSCLLLGAGAVYQNSKSFNLDEIGGMAKIMPLTMVTFLIAAFSISGIPPFNGFVSKWLIYQGIVTSNVAGWPIFLIACLLGSVLTLAAFIKQLQSVFFQYKRKNVKNNKDLKKAPFAMAVPMVILALFCVVIGIAATPLTKWLGGVIGYPGIVIPGYWEPISAIIFIIVGIGVAGLIYLLVKNKKIRECDIYIGSEKVEKDIMSYSGTHFFKTITELKILKPIYSLAKRKFFDVYEILKAIFLYISHLFSDMHTGVLGTYVIWLIIGLVAVVFYLVSGVV